MKEILGYVCEQCGKMSYDKTEIMECEASHYGLTVKEFQEWERLKGKCRYAGFVVSIRNNEETRREFDEVIDKCLQFEKEHNLAYCN